MDNNYSIVENCTLPSKGTIYNPVVDPEIEIRSMTTVEEMKRMSTTDQQYKLMSEIIDSCIVKGPELSSYDMCIGDYQFLLYKLRTVTYGSEYSFDCTCPYCRNINKEKISLDDFPVKEFSKSIEKYTQCDLPKTKQHVELKLQTPRDLDLITQEVKEFTKKTNNKQGDPAMIFTLRSAIYSVDGQQLDPIQLEDWIKKLPMRDTNYLIAYLNKLNTCIGVDTDLHCTCNLCGLEYDSPFRITNEFFRPEIDI